MTEVVGLDEILSRECQHVLYEGSGRRLVISSRLERYGSDWGSRPTGKDKWVLGFRFGDSIECGEGLVGKYWNEGDTGRMVVEDALCRLRSGCSENRDKMIDIILLALGSDGRPVC